MFNSSLRKSTTERTSVFKIAVFTFVVTLALSVALPANATIEKNWAFDVFLDNKLIGEHNFLVRTLDNKQTVRTSADFDVKFLFVTAFSYEHENTETWQDGCLSQIDATTLVNGDLSSVEGETVANTLSISANENNYTLNGCVSTFAYWDVSFLTKPELLNSQTGELEPVTVTKIGNENYALSDKLISATRYQITVDNNPIDLWYADDGRWLGLETLAKGGRVIRYQPTELPEPVRNATGD